MAAIKSLVAREALSTLAKRGNWASRNVGVMVVFCILGVVGIGLISLVVYKRLQNRKASRPVN